MTDVLACLVFGGVLLAGVGAGEVLRAWAGWRAEASRRFVHAWTGWAVALCPPFFSEPRWIYALAALFVVVNLVAVPRRLLPGMHGIARRSWGTVTFPLALIVALWACWTLDPGRVFALQIAFAVLATSDPLASWVGSRWGTRGYDVGGGPKSLQGSAACFFSALVVTAGGLLLVGPEMSVETVLGAALGVAALVTAAEALAGGGWDNLFIVVAACALLVLVTERPEDALQILVAAGLAVAFGALAFRLKLLDGSGALAASLLAFSVVAVGGWAWTVPGIAFFFTSSGLSKLTDRLKPQRAVRAAKGSRRDAGQVLANGGVAWALLAAFVFWPNAALFWGYAGAFAAAAADTWATEIGTSVGGPTRLMGLGRRVPAGESGGVSAAGTLGGLVGAGVVFASLVPFAAPYLEGVGWGLAAALVVGGGFVASGLDSLLGATLQARFRDPDGTVTEAPGERKVLVRGVRWLDNDAVNVAGTLAGGALPVAVLIALGV